IQAITSAYLIKILQNKRAKTVYNTSKKASYYSLELLKNSDFSSYSVDFLMTSPMDINTTNHSHIQTGADILARVLKMTEVTQTMALDTNTIANINPWTDKAWSNPILPL
ncbi:23069_t:CDS:2, partial [Gigaspora margarita]